MEAISKNVADGLIHAADDDFVDTDSRGGVAAINAPQQYVAGEDSYLVKQYFRDIAGIPRFSDQEELTAFKLIEECRRRLISALLDIPAGLEMIKERYSAAQRRVFENPSHIVLGKEDAVNIQAPDDEEQPVDNSSIFLRHCEVVENALDNLGKFYKAIQNKPFQYDPLELKSQLLDMLIELRLKDSELVSILDKIKSKKPGVRDGKLQAANEAQLLLENSKKRVIAANLHTVVYHVIRYKDQGLEMADLIQEANVGLAIAVEKFDYRRGYLLGALTKWWFKRELSKAIADKGRLIRLPIHTHQLVSAKMKAAREYAQLRGDSPNSKELAEFITERTQAKFIKETGRDPSAGEMVALQTKESSIAKLSQIGLYPIRLGQPVKGRDSERRSGDTKFGDALVDESVDDPREVAALKDEITILRDLMEILPEKQVTILRLRFGIGTGDKGKTLEEIGNNFGVTRERIRQIECKAMEKLRWHFNKMHRPGNGQNGEAVVTRPQIMNKPAPANSLQPQ